MSAAAVLADWVHRTGARDLTDEVKHAVGRHLLDGVGVTIAAARLGAGAPGWTVAHGLGGPPQARALTGREALSAPAAAMGTAMLEHALDFDDTHAGGLVHPTVTVLPTAFAVGQELSASGEQTLVAAALGLETVCRLGAVSPHGFHARGLHATGVVGPLAAAVTAGRLMGLPAARLVDALGIAGSSAGGLLEFLDSAADTKSLHPGSAAFAGVLAARLAAAGAAGPPSVLEGNRGVYATLSERAADLGVLTDDLGGRWEATQIGIKPYPSCQLMHVTLDAVSAAVAGIAVDPVEIVDIEVHVHPDSSPFVCGDHTGTAPPRSTYDAKFDLPWSVAALLHDGAVTVDTYSAGSIARDPVAATAKSVRVIPAPNPLPAAAAPGRAALTLRDGRILTGEVAGSKGTPAVPMSDAEVRAKFTGNCAGHMRADELADRILDLSAEADLTVVHDLASLIASDRHGAEN
ncbi:MmgE/PrpD family protein [Nocardia jinanensis]|uniref:MmgE/Prp family protein n=1 Tax=Nocardia jinanensis TaxID=382504 RepID=A0A917R580_9NOCA|nr:MmgE/PrpD family protein [Nocardia jinanensis]GGK90283.1 MmgE/Prp family protein [Nocardia jinanensis]